MPQTPDPLLAIERAVIATGGKDKFLAYVADHWPRMVGASIADVLEHTTSYDMFLAETEPFYEAHESEMPPGCPNTAALHALIILGGELSMYRLLRLLAHAGLIPAPAVPEHPEHTTAGPAGCPRCQLLRDNRGWMERQQALADAVRGVKDVGELHMVLSTVLGPKGNAELAALMSTERGQDRSEYRLLVDPEPGEPTPVAELPAIWRRAAARTGSGVSTALEGCAMVLERALAAQSEDPRS